MPERCVIPLLHPSFIVRGGWMWRGTVVRDMLGAHNPVKPEPVAYDPAWDPRRLPVPPTGPLAVDLETIRGTDTITQINWSWAPRIAVAGAWGGLVEAESRRLLATDRLKILHHAQFDLLVLHANGIRVGGPLYDTMIAAAILEPDLPNNLEHVTRDYSDIQPWKHLSTVDQGTYGCIDGDATFRVFEGTREDLKAEGVLKVFETSMEVLPLLNEMHLTGLRIDKKYMQQRAVECDVAVGLAKEELDRMVQGLVPRQQRVADLMAQQDALLDQAGNEALKKIERLRAKQAAAKLQKQIKVEVEPNWNSQKQLLPILDDLGLAPRVNHKTGRVTTDAAAIQELARQTGNKVLIKLLDLREQGKLKSTYFSQKIGEDGRIHPKYLLHRDYDVEGGEEGACSGRLASKEPNIQNWPKTTRGIVVPDEDGWEGCKADYKQIEFMIIAWRTGGRLWKDVNTAGFDIHRRLAAEVYGGSLASITEEQRDEGKRCVYAGVYGVGPLTLSRRLAAEGIFMSVAQAKRFIETFKKLYPEIARTQADWVNEAIATNRVRNPFGRYRRFYRPNEEVTKIYNNYPQSTAGDIILRAMARIKEQLPKPARLAIQVHDELVFWFPKDIRKEVLTCVKENMEVEEPEMPGFRPQVTLKVGPSWGSMTGLQEIC